MDLEARRAKLKEMREARARGQPSTVVASGAPSTTTAKPGEGAEGNAASAAPSAAVTPPQASSSATSVASASPPRGTTTQQVLSFNSRVVSVSIENEPPPPPTPKYDKGCLTDFVYVSDVPPKAEEAPASPAVEAPSTASAGNLGFLSPQRRGTSLSNGFTSWSSIQAAKCHHCNEAEANIIATQQEDSLRDFVAHISFVLSRSAAAPSAEKSNAQRSTDESTHSIEGAFGIKNLSERSHSIERISRRRTLADVSCEDKIVTALAFQPNSAEFCAAAYSGNDASSTADCGTGLVHVWAVDHPASHPALSFTCDSDVCALSYNDFSPQLLYGGTYSGQLVTWDIRRGSRPVWSSFPGTDAHTTPINAVTVVGSSTAHSLLSCSQDGNVCIWPDKPVVPTESGSLQCGQAASRYPIPANTLAVPEYDQSKFVVGSSDGYVLEGSRGTSSQRQIDLQRLSGAPHASAVTSVHCHPRHANGRISSLIASSSVDFTCKVWSASSGKCVTIDQFQDFVYDVKWSPTRPLVLAAGDGSGRVSVFDVAHSTTVPCASIVVGSGVGVNKIAFDHSGRHIVAGCSKGQIVVLSLAHSLASAADTTAVAEFAGKFD